MKCNCPFLIHLKFNKDKKVLYVSEFNSKHNHETSESEEEQQVSIPPKKNSNSLSNLKNDGCEISKLAPINVDKEKFAEENDTIFNFNKVYDKQNASEVEKQSKPTEQKSIEKDDIVVLSEILKEQYSSLKVIENNRVMIMESLYNELNNVIVECNEQKFIKITTSMSQMIQFLRNDQPFEVTCWDNLLVNMYI